MPQPQPQDNSRGFTLLEVLVAFVVTAVMMVVLLRTFTGGLDGSVRSANSVAATLAAQSALDAAGPLVPLEVGSEQDTSEGPFRIHTQIRSRTDLIAADPETLYIIPYDVAVTVSWREGGRDRSIFLHGLRLGPHAQQ